jgi:hypothetical protein
MNVKLTIDDLLWLPGNKRNCATCTYRGIDCPRMAKSNPQGYVKSATGELGGMIAGCQRWQGKA